MQLLTCMPPSINFASFTTVENIRDYPDKVMHYPKLEETMDSHFWAPPFDLTSPIFVIMCHGFVNVQET